MLHRATFGILPDGRAADVITLRNGAGVEMRVITYGCVIVWLSTPNRDARFDTIVLGFDRLESYVADPLYFGAVVGRYANRIANARFVLDGRAHPLGANEPPHHLHGGFNGFDRHLWAAEAAGNGRGVVLRRRSPDGEEGYPGNLDAQVTYTLADENVLLVEYEAETDAPTHVGLTQHSYFNLRGAGDGASGDVLEHRLEIDADTYLPTTTERIPTGEIAPVVGTPLDFRKPMALGAGLGGSYDHSFILNRSKKEWTRAARLFEPATGRTMEVSTTEPVLHLYSGNLRGVCVETQHYPDSPNRPQFPSTVLRPGERYYSKTEFAFGIAHAPFQPGIGYAV